MSVNTTYLALSWSVSRGRDTYGYNICRLDAPVPDRHNTGSRRYRCNGGGYDMTGTVLADWLCDIYQARLRALASRASAICCAGNIENRTGPEILYGLYLYPGGRVSIDGACGIESVLRVAEAIGITWSANCNRKGHTQGFMVTDYGSAQALQEARR